MSDLIYMDKLLIGNLNKYSLSQGNIYDDLITSSGYTEKVLKSFFKRIEGTILPEKTFMEVITHNQILGIEHYFEILLNGEPLKYTFSGFFESISIIPQPSLMCIEFIINLISELQMTNLNNKQTIILPIENLIKKKQKEELKKLQGIINEKVENILDGLKNKIVDKIVLDSSLNEVEETEEEKKKHKGRSIIL